MQFVAPASPSCRRPHSRPHVPDQLNTNRRFVEAKGIRNLSKADMKYNSETPDIKVDPETYVLTVNGEEIHSEPAEELAMAQRYFLF